MHKTANVLNAMAKSAQPKAKGALHEIWMAPIREDAQRAFDHFITTYEPKYPKAVQAPARLFCTLTEAANSSVTNMAASKTTT